MWSYEQKAVSNGFSHIAGVDEAGRGPLAGPVISAAVILPDNFDPKEITDSKKLTEKKRHYLFEYINDTAAIVGVGVSEADEIDRINILQASLTSMARAVEGLTIKPDYLLIDGIYQIPAEKITYSIKQEPIKKGDSLSVSIAAASIIAKVTRDRIMLHLDEKYPGYTFAKHKGYPTKAHKEAVAKLGPSPVHRLTFKGVKEFVC